jgi:hypothetical protein
MGMTYEEYRSKQEKHDHTHPCPECSSLETAFYADDDEHLYAPREGDTGSRILCLDCGASFPVPVDR